MPVNAPFCDVNYLCDGPALDIRQIFKLLAYLLEKKHLLEEWYVVNRTFLHHGQPKGTTYVSPYPLKSVSACTMALAEQS